MKEKIFNAFKSNEDKSAAINLYLKSFNQTKYRRFLTKEVDLQDLMRHFATNKNANLLNLFSILMHDWNEPKSECFDYCLCEKFDQYELSGGSLMKKLINFFNVDELRPYHHVCMRIIYHFLHEKEFKLEKKSRLTGYDKYTANEERNFQFMLDDSINKALKIKNEESRNEILKILTIYLKTTPVKTYESQKEEVLIALYYKMDNYSPYEASIDSIAKLCDNKFFELIFLSKENCLASFELRFDKFIETYKKYYGEYWSIAIKPNIRLLFHLATKERDQSEYSEIVDLILNKCSFIDMSSSILATFREVGDFFIIFNGTLQRKERKFLVSFVWCLSLGAFEGKGKLLRNILMILIVIFFFKRMKSTIYLTVMNM